MRPHSRFSKISRALFIAFAATLPFHAHAAELFTNVNLNITQADLTITALPDGNNLWDLKARVVNSGATTLSNLYFLFLGEYFYDSGSASYQSATWDNINQEWTYNSPTLQNAYSKPYNPATYILMDPSNTNVSYPAGVAGDSLAAYFIASTLAPGESATFDVLEELSANILYSSSGSYAEVSAVAAPEPNNYLAFITLGGALYLFGRRNLRHARTIWLSCVNRLANMV